MSTFVGIPRIPTAAPETEMDPQDARGVRMAVSVLLDYPGDDFEIKLDAVEEALADLPEPASASLASFVSYARAAGLRAMQTTYVETFDQRRRCALGLTYYTHGDTRGRGQAILAFKEVLRRAGFEMDREELPDHLPVVLEFAAFDETGTAEGLLRSNREGIEVIRTALRATDSPYAPLLDALVATLPEPDEKTIEGFRKLISQGPPTELVAWAICLRRPSRLPIQRWDGNVHGIRTFACRVSICDAVAVLPGHCPVGGSAVRVLRDPHRGSRVALQDRPVRVDVSFLAVE